MAPCLVDVVKIIFELITYHISQVRKSNSAEYDDVIILSSSTMQLFGSKTEKNFYGRGITVRELKKYNTYIICRQNNFNNVII